LRRLIPILPAIAAVIALVAGPASGGFVLESTDFQGVRGTFRLESFSEPGGPAEEWAGMEIPGFTSLFDDSLGLHVPVSAELVALPQGSDVICEISNASYYKIDGYEVATALANIDEAGFEMPEAPAEITSIGFIRNQRVGTLRISPVVLDPSSGELRIYERFEVNVAFRGGAGATRAAGRAGRGETGVVNPEQAGFWLRPSIAGRAQDDYFTSSSTWIKVFVETTGVFCLTGEDLSELGIDLAGIDPGTLRLYTGGGLPLKENLAEENPSWMSQVAVRVAGGGDGSLDTSDSLFFYGLGLNDWKNFYNRTSGVEAYYKSLFSDRNVYWLTWGGSFTEPASRMNTRILPVCEGCDYYQPESFFERMHAERNSIVDFSVHAEDGWYWRFLRLDNSALVTAELADPDTSRQAVFKVRLADWQGANSCPGGIYRVVLRIDGTALTDTMFGAGLVRNRVQDLYAAGKIGPGDNHTVEVYTPSELEPPYTGAPNCERLYLAWVEAYYWRNLVAREDRLLFQAPDTTATARFEIGGFTGPGVYAFDVSDQYKAELLSGVSEEGPGDFTVSFYDTTRQGAFRRYALVGAQTLRKPAAMEVAEIADIRNNPYGSYVIITHPDLLGPASTIAGLRDGEVVTVGQVFDEFGWGVPDVTAIRDFLRWRLRGDPPLERVLLFGDATWDYKGYLTSASYPNYVPTYEGRYLPPVEDPYCTDDWLVYLEPAEGETTALYPTVPISRLPAISPEDGELLAGNVESYASNPPPGVWQNRVILVADDDLVASGCEGANSPHTMNVEQLSDEAYPQVFEHVKIYLTEYALTPTGVKPEAKNDFIRELNAGALMVNFSGHGDPNRLAQEEVFNPAALDLVQTGGRCPFFIAASCNVSRFDEPSSSSMAEELLRRPAGGTIGSLSSTHLCLPVPNQALNRYFVQNLFPSGEPYPTVPVGDAVMEAKALTAGISRRYKENNEMYALLGDGALRLSVPRLRLEFDRPVPDTLARKSVYGFQVTAVDTDGVAGWFAGDAEIYASEAEDTTGYVSCAGRNFDYELPGAEIYRGRASFGEGTLDQEFFVSAGARQGARGQIRCFATDGQTSGSGVLDSLAVSGDVVFSDDDGPAIEAVYLGSTLATGDTVAAGGSLTIELEDDSGIAVKGKSAFIPTVSAAFDDGDRIDLSDSVYAVEGDFRRASVSFDIPSLSLGTHRLSISGFDNLNNLTTVDYDVVVAGTGGEAANTVFAYPNPAHDICYIIWEYEGAAQAEVEVAIYTLSGRKIWETVTSGLGSYHEVAWDLTDRVGDRVANGTYIVVVKAGDPSDPGFGTEDRIVVAVIR
jgi:hypothetical protein